MGIGAAGDRQKGVAALPAAHRCTAAAAAWAAATARGRAAAAASSTSALPPPDGPSGSQPGPRARSLRRRRPGRPGRLWEPAGGARAQGGLQKSRAGRLFSPGVQPAPQPLEGGHLPRGTERSGAGVSPPPGARSASSLSRGNPPLAGNAAPPPLTPGCSNPGREQNMGRRAPHHPCSFPDAPALGWSDTGRRGGGWGPRDFSLPALLLSAGGETADSRAERTEGRGAFHISVL